MAFALLWTTTAWICITSFTFGLGHPRPATLFHSIQVPGLCFFLWFILKAYPCGWTTIPFGSTTMVTRGSVYFVGDKEGAIYSLSCKIFFGLNSFMYCRWMGRLNLLFLSARNNTEVYITGILICLWESYNSFVMFYFMKVRQNESGNEHQSETESQPSLSN